MKKLATWVLAFVFALSFALPQGTAFANADTVKLVVDGVEVEGYEQAFVSHDQVLIPVEDLFNEAGFKVSKDKAGKVNVTNTYLTVDFNASAGTINVNGEKADTEFPLTLQNYGNYISGDFLATLEGFEVEVSEDQKTVNVTTNRVEDVAAFLAKSAAADLKSVSSTLKMDLKMESSLEEEEINMAMDITMDQINEPLSFYMLSKTTADLAGEKIEDVAGAYFTEEGYFQQIGDVWVKYDEEVTKGLLEVAASEDLLAQITELQNKFTAGINIYEYEDVYVMTQTITNEEFGAMMEEVMALVLGSELTSTIEVTESTEATDVEATEEVVEMTVLEEATKVEEAAEEEATEVKATKVEEATEVEATEEEATEEEEAEVTDATESTEAIETTEEEVVIDLEGLGFNIEEFFVVSTFDKKTLFPIDLSATAHITMTMDEDTITIKLLMTGAFSNYNSVKEIKVPADVIKNAISMDEFIKILEAEIEAELKKAEEDAKK